MHELGIAQNIIAIAERVAKRNGGGRIAAVTVQAGELRAVIREQLELCFEFAAKGTLAEGARLDVHVIPIEALCDDCSKPFRVKNLTFRCPRCGGESVRVLKGQELKVLDLELA